MTLRLFTHNLPSLAKLAGVVLSQAQEEFLVLLSQYYLNTRYIDFKQKLTAEMNRDKAQECLQKSQELIACLKKEFTM